MKITITDTGRTAGTATPLRGMAVWVATINGVKKTFYVERRGDQGYYGEVSGRVNQYGDTVRQLIAALLSPTIDSCDSDDVSPRLRRAIKQINKVLEFRKALAKVKLPKLPKRKVP